MKKLTKEQEETVHLAAEQLATILVEQIVEDAVRKKKAKKRDK